MATSSLTATVYSARTLSSIDRGARDLSASIYRLSSGNRYADGEESSALTLAVQLKANAAAYRQSLKNSAQASSLLETASGGLTQISALLANARATAVAAQSDVLTDAERIYLQTSLESDLAAIDAIASTTRFNETYLLNGDLAAADGGEALTFAISTDADSILSFEIRDASTDRLLPDGTPSLLSSDDVDDAVDAIDDALDLLDAQIARLGGDQSRVDYAANNLSRQIYGADAAASELSETDIAEESTQYALQLLTQKAAYAVLAQSRNLDSALLALLSPVTTPQTFFPKADDTGFGFAGQNNAA